jgi:FkbM family methyltransferase
MGDEMQFYSQIGQDKYVLESFFRGKRRGVFLDIGAYDGEKFSNTLFFERSMDWTGLCVEPLPSAFARLQSRRKAICENVAVADFEGEADFLDCDAGIDEKMLSGLPGHFDTRHAQRIQHSATAAETIKVPVSRLGALLEKHSLYDIDFCSLDTEGSEMAILEDLDLDRFRISVFTIENNYGESALRELMARKGYEFVARLQWDDVYRRRDVPRLSRTTVITAVWHNDPKRWELLRGHQWNLHALEAPVDAIYVFDNGEQAPDWLVGKSISSKTPLTIYQAWNMALSQVETPFVMNLNLDDRLAPDAVNMLEVAILRDQAALIGGEWNIRYTQEETDAVVPAYPASELPFDSAWPPRGGVATRLGSGTGERGTYGPAVMWRMDTHIGAPRYPWRMADGTKLINHGGDLGWWLLVEKHLKKKMTRLPYVIGNYYSHPEQQLDFRATGNDEHAMLASDVGLSLL